MGDDDEETIGIRYIHIQERCQTIWQQPWKIRFISLFSETNVYILDVANDVHTVCLLKMYRCTQYSVSRDRESEYIGLLHVHLCFNIICSNVLAIRVWICGAFEPTNTIVLQFNCDLGYAFAAHLVWYIIIDIKSDCSQR